MEVKFILGAFTIACLHVVGCAPMSPGPTLEVVPAVDLSRYAGRWYEIARYPAAFEEGCRNVTADYIPREDGKLTVLNRCDQPNRESRVSGVARVPDADQPAKLKVQFFWPFEADYWIIELDPEYGWAVVGEPRRQFLWILSRTPTMDDAVYADILTRIENHSYEPGRLVRTPQGG